MESGNQNRTGSAIIPGRESSARILIVEDEPISATILQRHLKDMGHSLIGPISRGEKAIEVALSESMKTVAKLVKKDAIFIWQIREGAASLFGGKRLEYLLALG